METSKKILVWTMIIFFSQLIEVGILTWFNKDISIFQYIIPSTAGISGTTIMFYLNKAKIENILKGKIEFLKFQIEEMKNCPEKEKIEAQVEKVNELMDSNLESSIKKALDQDTNISKFL